jgi:periplasmic protein CpxP/Spy
MKRTKKIILSLGAIALLSTVSFAYSGNKNSCEMKTNHHKMMKMKHHKPNHNIIGTIMKLDLTPKQKEEITKILQKAGETKKSPSNAFTAKDFNKEMFVKLMKEQKETRIKQKAQTIEKIYTLLNETQKKNLKTLLDMRTLKYQQMTNKFLKGKGCNDKNCNGRG